MSELLSCTHVLIDLDDSLFWSQRKLGHRAQRAVAFKAGGEAYGFMSSASDELLTILERARRVIPVTARVSTSLGRVQLSFSDYKICAQGGIIIDAEGHVDKAWLDEGQARLRRLSERPHELADRLADMPPLSGLRVVVRADYDTAFFCTIRDPDRRPERLAAVLPALSEQLSPGWTLAATNTDVVLRPEWLTKGAAVRHLYAHHIERPELLIGLGDRHDDRDFLELCDYILMPRQSDLWQAAGQECR